MFNVELVGNNGQVSVPLSGLVSVNLEVKNMSNEFKKFPSPYRG